MRTLIPTILTALVCSSMACKEALPDDLPDPATVPATPVPATPVPTEHPVVDEPFMVTADCPVDGPPPLPMLTHVEGPTSMFTGYLTGRVDNQGRHIVYTPDGPALRPLDGQPDVMLDFELGPTGLLPDYLPPDGTWWSLRDFPLDVPADFPFPTAHIDIDGVLIDDAAMHPSGAFVVPMGGFGTFRMEGDAAPETLSVPLMHAATYSHDGAWLYYVDNDALWRLPVDADGRPTSGPPENLRNVDFPVESQGFGLVTAQPRGLFSDACGRLLLWSVVVQDSIVVFDGNTMALLDTIPVHQTLQALYPRSQVGTGLAASDWFLLDDREDFTQDFWTLGFGVPLTD